MPNSSRKRDSKKPAKPRPDFPLFPHATGRWAKKIKGKFVYFGKVADDPNGERALNKWLDEKDDLLAGRTPRKKTGALTVRELLNKFLNSKRLAAETGEIRLWTFRDYRHQVCPRIGRVLGLTTAVVDLTAVDFEQLRKEFSTWSLATQAVAIAKARGVFNYAYQTGLIEHPIRFGPMFRAPSEKLLRKGRQEKRDFGEGKMFEAEEIKQLLARCLAPMRAIIFLGINAGFGNNDAATLRRAEVDLDKGWVVHPRPKTGAPRRCPLWPETTEALRLAYRKRPEPADQADADLFFLTDTGLPMLRLVYRKPPNPADSTNGDPVSLADAGLPTACRDLVGNLFFKAMRRAGIHRTGRGFYALRHTFETIAGDCRDQVAVDFIMGHTRGDMASVYRERIEDERLRAVTDHVQKWLFGPAATETAKDQGAQGTAAPHHLRIVG